MVPFSSLRKKDAAVIGGRTGQLGETPLDVKCEVVEFLVETKPFMASVSIANNDALCWVDMPLRNLAHGMIGWDGDTSPSVRIVVREQVDGL